MTPLQFVIVYAGAVVAFVPGAWMTILGGALFGIVRGAAYSFVGAVVGSTAAFLIARFGARAFVIRHLAARPRAAAVEREVSARGLPLVLLLRLSPVVPFNVLNYVLGVTTLSVRQFLWASVGMIPATFLYAYAGRVAGETAAFAGTAGPPHGTSYYVILAAGLAATAAAVALVVGAARRALRDV